MATKLIPHSPELDHVLNQAAAIRDAVAAAGASDPRVIGAVARGESTNDEYVTLFVSSRPKLSLFRLVELEQRLSDLLGREVNVWMEEGFRPDERARYVAEAIAL